MKLLLLCVLLAGCEKQLTNAEIITQEKQCSDAGLVAHEYGDAINGRTVFIQCGKKYEVVK